MSHQSKLPRGRASAGTEESVVKKIRDDMQKKDKTTMRIISQNCNGITKQSNHYNLQLELNNLLETEFDVLMLQETNLN